jgi:uncharacterized membrane protein YgdD (TMEM256/DUF423 family)
MGYAHSVLDAGEMLRWLQLFGAVLFSGSLTGSRLFEAASDDIVYSSDE